MNFASRLAAVTLAALLCLMVPASAQQAQSENLPPPQREAGPNTYTPDELVASGHRFFGNVSRGLASIIERAVSQGGQLRELRAKVAVQAGEFELRLVEDAGRDGFALRVIAPHP